MYNKIVNNPPHLHAHKQNTSYGTFGERKTVGFKDKVLVVLKKFGVSSSRKTSPA
jgi:hypothetical protein